MTQKQKPIQGMGFCIVNQMEREKRLELSTYTLARYRSTN